MRDRRVIAAPALLVLAAIAPLLGCSSEGGGGGDAGGDGATSDGGGSSDAGPFDPGGVPGGPPNDGPIRFVVNGQPRSLPGGASYFTSPSADGGTRLGVAIQGGATVGSPPTSTAVTLTVFEAAPGTFSCGVGAGMTMSLGSFPDWGLWSSGTCTVTLQLYGPAKGDRVKGTFSGERDLDEQNSKPGSTPHLSVTEGTFDVVQTVDPPQ